MAKTRISLRATEKRKPSFPNTGHARDYCSIAWRYAIAAINDKDHKKHCKWVRLAAKRFVKDYRNKRKWWKFDPWHGNDVCDFIEKLPHVDGVWDTPDIRLEPVQVFILVCIFGFRKKSDGTRRFSDVYIEMARKGAKSTLSGGISHYCLECENEPGAQIVVAASTREQADKVFEPARLMAVNTPDLREAFDVEVWANSITCGLNNGFIRPINSKSTTQDGWNPHVVIVDELHAHKTPGLHNVLKSSMGARKNQMMWRITTAGYDPNGVCFEQRTMVTKVLEGLVELDHYFGIIFTLDQWPDGEDEPDDEPLDEKCWIKANPMYGVTPDKKTMRDLAKEAAVSPTAMAEFKTKRVNIWTTSKGGWLNMERWKRLAKNAVLPDERETLVWAGVDLASVSDLTSLGLIWWQGSKLHITGRHYLPEAAIDERSRRGDFLYENWVDQGHLIVTPGERCDYDWIEADIKQALTQCNVQYIGFDPYNATQVINNLQKGDAPCLDVPQVPKTMHLAMQEFERLMLGREIVHDGNPVLAWAASNVVCRRDVNDNKAPDKKNSMDKIDPIAAVLNAMVPMLTQEGPKRSVYEERGLLSA